MIDLSNLEAWFVTGSQHLYGPETLKKVEQHANAIANAIGASPAIPVKDCCQASDDQQRSDSPVVPGSQQPGELRRHRHMDAYFLSGSHVDRGPAIAKQAIAAPTYSIQSRGDPLR